MYEAEGECVISFCIQGTQDFLFSLFLEGSLLLRLLEKNANVQAVC